MALDNEPEHSSCAGPSSVEGASLTSHPRAPARDCTGPSSFSASQTRAPLPKWRRKLLPVRVGRHKCGHVTTICAGLHESCAVSDIQARGAWVATGSGSAAASESAAARSHWLHEERTVPPHALPLSNPIQRRNLHTSPPFLRQNGKREPALPSDPLLNHPRTPCSENFVVGR